jgi:hypothetical protein
MNTIIRTLIHTILIWAGVNLAALIAGSGGMPVLAAAFRIIGFLDFFLFSVVTACVLNGQWAFMFVVIAVTGLATMHWAGIQAVQMLYPTAAGIMLGALVQKMLAEGKSIRPPS